jgi:drug/metabolite transporter (DMT)-like permease
MAHSKGEFHMKGWGIFMVIAGALLILYAYAAPSAPEFSQTVNYEMMQMKTLHAIAGAACLVAGAIWSAVGVVVDRISPASQRPEGRPAGSSVPAVGED